MTDKTSSTPFVEGRAEQCLNGAITRFNRWPAALRTVLVVASCVLGALLLLGIISAPLDLYSQCLFAGVCFLAVLVLRKIPGRLAILALVVLSLVASLRYMFWRITSTLGFETWIDMFFGYGLVAAEFYALIVLIFGYVQTAWPLRRTPVWLKTEPEEWPTVDVFIPTYNEALSIVKLTIFAAQAMDWPKDKLRVHVLDDGRRDDFREFCRKVGVNYIRRDNNFHAKAGNLNEALKVTDGEYIALFDADHVPTRSFLQVSLGWFLKDPKLAMLQTPHFFFSPDPFEKNLDTFRAVPNEGELFYGLVQDGNDLWNATFFCGSCAVIRREPLLEIGGVAIETVTEDAHTALKLNRLGYNTAYLAIPQAAGLATESLSRHQPADSLGAGHGADFPHRQPAAGQRPEVGPAHLLRERHAALLLWFAAPGVPHRAAGLPDFRRGNLPCLGTDDRRLCAAALGALQPDQLTDPGAFPSLVLERGVRDRAGLVHPAAGAGRAGQPQGRWLQRHRQGRDHRQTVLRLETRPPVPGVVGSEPGRPGLWYPSVDLGR